MPDLSINLAALFILLGLTAYALLAGADFGGGVWDLFASGPRKHDQRTAVHTAIGPVWEANHVWLIFVIVLLFTCFPNGYTHLATALFAPLHLALLGIMLRGAAFIFRHNTRPNPSLPGERLHNPLWQSVFGIASLLSPLLLGAAFGSITSGNLRIIDNHLIFLHPHPWLTPYALSCGFLALAACAYLAAVYLCVETKDPLRDDFRRRAILAGTATAALSGITLFTAHAEAPWFFHRLLSASTAPVIAAGLAAFALSAWAIFTRRYKLARIAAAAEITLLLLGWALAHYPYFLYPDLTLHSAAGPLPTIHFLLLASTLGLLILIPSLAFLFKVFKSQPPQNNAPISSP